MTDIQAMVAEFHEKFSAPNNLGNVPDAFHERTNLRYDLILEEFREFGHSQGVYLDDYYAERSVDIDEVDTIEYADALADLVYVCFGAAIEAGIDLNAVLEEVHLSNMRKTWPDGKAHYRDDGKVSKPADWTPPNIKEVLGL